MKKGDTLDKRIKLLKQTTFPFTVIGGVMNTRSEPHALAIDDVQFSH